MDEHYANGAGDVSVRAASDASERAPATVHAPPLGNAPPLLTPPLNPAVISVPFRYGYQVASWSDAQILSLLRNRCRVLAAPNMVRCYDLPPGA